MADVMVALDRADLPPEAIDTAVRALTDEGVDVLDVPVEDDTFSEAEIRQAERGAAADRARNRAAARSVPRMPSVAIRLHSDSLAPESIDCASKAAATPFFCFVRAPP